MRLFPEETISICRKIMNRTGYRGAPKKVKDACYSWVFGLLSFPELTHHSLNRIVQECQMDTDEFDYYYKQVELRTHS